MEAKGLARVYVLSVPRSLRRAYPVPHPLIKFAASVPRWLNSEAIKLWWIIVG